MRGAARDKIAEISRIFLRVFYIYGYVPILLLSLISFSLFYSLSLFLHLYFFYSLFLFFYFFFSSLFFFSFLLCPLCGQNVSVSKALRAKNINIKISVNIVFVAVFASLFLFPLPERCYMFSNYTRRGHLLLK